MGVAYDREVGFGFQFGILESSLHEQDEKLSSLGAPPRYDFVFKTLWNYIPGLLLDLIQYMPTFRYRRFRRYSAFMRNFSRGIIEKSVIEGDGKDVMSVLLRENAFEDPRGRLCQH
ncbi:hypothetical protein EDB85DRAFT_822342 [Lactarius pseudohatsudake]|nr:hypothetical protein EDB85DRAFT_822342 [Lactarius pseudohatsudake]